jgi:ferredoxin
MYRRPDGIVDFDKSICIGCKACIAACPYDAIFINPDDHSAEKCNFCAHRIDVGLEPACVVVCPTEAILVGDLNDPSSRVAQIVGREPVAVRRPEKETDPKLFYKGAHPATLDPIAARRPSGGLFMWSEQGRLPQQVTSGHPDGWNGSSAAALLSYDVPREAPWGWRVSLYTWTKAIAAGTYLVPLLLLLGGMLSWTSILWLWSAPVLAGVFLGATLVLLVTDLKHPERCILIFTRPRWSSWLVKGAFVITGYGAVLAVHAGTTLLGGSRVQAPLAVLGGPLAVVTAVYTAYLLAQAKARDLWQNPLLAPHFLIQAFIAGSAALVPVALRFEPELVRWLLWILGGSSLLHLLVVGGEAPLSHSTAHARLAVHELFKGRYRMFSRSGVVLSTLGLIACGLGVTAALPSLDPWVALSAVPLALAGLLAYEHGYVQAGQAVPLA